MRALLLESPADLPADWLQELADDFIEDPGCRVVLFGGDEYGVVLFSTWAPSLVEEVANGLRAALPEGATIRLLALADSGFGESPAGGVLGE